MINFLSPQDELYCVLRTEGCEPAYALKASRDFSLESITWPERAAINEASPFIQARYRELGRPDLIRTAPR